MNYPKVIGFAKATDTYLFHYNGIRGVSIEDVNHIPFVEETTDTISLLFGCGTVKTVEKKFFVPKYTIQYPERNGEKIKGFLKGSKEFENYHKNPSNIYPYIKKEGEVYTILKDGEEMYTPAYWFNDDLSLRNSYFERIEDFSSLPTAWKIKMMNLLHNLIEVEEAIIVDEKASIIKEMQQRISDVFRDTKRGDV